MATVFQTVFDVEGMVCGSCTAAIRSAMGQLKPAMLSVDVSLEANRATVCHKQSLAPQAIADKIEDIGFGATVKETKQLTAAGELLLSRLDHEQSLFMELLACVTSLSLMFPVKRRRSFSAPLVSPRLFDVCRTTIDRLNIESNFRLVVLFVCAWWILIRETLTTNSTKSTLAWWARRPHVEFCVRQCREDSCAAVHGTPS